MPEIDGPEGPWDLRPLARTTAVAWAVCSHYSVPPMIRVEQLQKRYGTVRAVDGVSFQVERGEVVGFLGPNGAGKSTTMKILTGFLAPDGGLAEIDGHAVHADAGVGSEQLEARRRVGYLPESTPLYRGMRVDRYLDFVGRVRGLPRAARRDAFERVVAECDLGGYERRRIGTLSKGYRQRVGLAQALLAEPEVLILDEPTSGLDPAEIVRIRELVRRLGRERTVLLSTHVLGEVQEACRRVIILTAGRLVADGDPLELAAEEDAGLGVTLRGAPEDAAQELAELDGVVAARPLGADAGGRARYALAVEERFAAAEAVYRLAARRGWGLCELRHEVPSLESVFLRKTRGAAGGEDA